MHPSPLLVPYDVRCAWPMADCTERCFAGRPDARFHPWIYSPHSVCHQGSLGRSFALFRAVLVLSSPQVRNNWPRSRVGRAARAEQDLGWCFGAVLVEPANSSAVLWRKGGTFRAKGLLCKSASQGWHHPVALGRWLRVFLNTI